MRAERRPSALRALMVSDGNRPCWSTSSAAGPEISSAMRAIRRDTSLESDTTGASSVIDVMASSCFLHLEDAGSDGGDRLERGLPQHLLRELDVEGVLQRQHHIDAGVGGHPRGEQIGVLFDRARVHRQSAVLGQDIPDGLVHGHSSLQATVSGRPTGRSPLLRIPTTTAAAIVDSWVRLTASSAMPASTANSAARPRRRISHQPPGSRWTSMLRQSGRVPSGRKTLTVASLAAKRAANDSTKYAVDGSWERSGVREHMISWAVKIRSMYRSPNR